MVRCLSEGDKVILSSSMNETEFTIEEVVGAGGSCIAYKVSYTESGNIVHRGILKEYCPAFLKNAEGFKRNGSALNIPSCCDAEFERGLIEFKNVYKTINDYLSNNLSAANYHTVQIGLFSGNNTLYTLTSCDYGKSYDKISDKDLYSLLNLMLSITKAVELYHNAGFLHLDIKPKNILVLDDVTEIVKLFDFDSLTSIDSIKKREALFIPVPEDYYVPELNNIDLRNIGIQTDIFEIGAMLFCRLFGRSPSHEDMSRDAIFDFDSPTILTGVSPTAKHELNLLLKNTIQTSRRYRFKTIEDLKMHLTKLVSMVDSNKPYVMNLPKWQPSAHSVGRESEIKEIKQRLDTDGYVFIKGVGGLGKSEIAKLFCQKNCDEYHTVQFCKYEGSLKTVVATMPVSGIDDSSFGTFDELAKAKNKVLHSSDSHTLIVVDNFNVTHDDFLREFLPTNNNSFKVIFTTRCQMAASYYADKTLHLSNLSMEDCKQLFYAHSKRSDEYTEKLIETIDYNTLVLVLLAEAINRSGESTANILAKLRTQRMEDISSRVFHEYDFTSEEAHSYNKIYAHLKVIFDINKLADIHKEILKNLTLIPNSGIRINTLLYYCNNPAIKASVIYDLVEYGWVSIIDQETVCLHPVISDLVAINNNIQKKESYYNLVDCLEDYCNPDYNGHFSIVINKLSYAQQLVKRYKSEPEEDQIFIITKLGNLYANAYHHSEARKKMKEALRLAVKVDYQFVLPYIYKFLGEIEKDFGTITDALGYYRKAIQSTKCPDFDNYSFIVGLMVDYCECLILNGDYSGALEKLEKAFRYAYKHSLDDCTYNIASRIIDVARELNLPQVQDKYRNFINKHGYHEEDVHTEHHWDQQEVLALSGDFDSVIQNNEEYLLKLRSQLGENSPIYKEYAQTRWVYFAANREKDQALRLASDNLAFFENTYGKNSMEVASQFVTMSKMFPRLDEYTYAIELAKRAIEICHFNHQEKSYTAFRAYLSLAALYSSLGKFDDAKEIVSELNMEAFSGTDALSEIVNSAGNLLCELSRYDTVEKICCELLRRPTVDLYSEVHAYVLLSYSNIQKNDLNRADFYLKKGMNLLSRLKDGPVKQSMALQCCRFLSSIWSGRGRDDKAIEVLSSFLNEHSDESFETYTLAISHLELGLYYHNIGNLAEVKKNNEICESFFRKLNLPENSFITLYNNMVLNSINNSDLESADFYFNKIISISPGVLTPKTYNEALICNNAGWLALKKDDIMTAGKYFSRAVKAYERLGGTNTFDYLLSLENLAYAYLLRGEIEKGLSAYDTVFELYDKLEVGVGVNFRKAASVHYANALLSENRFDDAVDFAHSENLYYASRFGENSLYRMDLLIALGDCFIACKDTYCKNLFDIALDIAIDGDHFNTRSYATLLNYLGVFSTDYEQEHKQAEMYFIQAKELLDSLDDTGCETYNFVISNLKYIEDLIG